MISKQVGTKAKAAPAVRLLGVGRPCSQAEHYQISQAPTPARCRAWLTPRLSRRLTDAIVIARDRYRNFEALWQVFSCDHCINLARQSLDNSST
jgi:hypothetical protein